MGDREVVKPMSAETKVRLVVGFWLSLAVVVAAVKAAWPW